MEKLASRDEVEFGSQTEFKLSLPAFDRSESQAALDFDVHPPISADKVADSIGPDRKKTSEELFKIVVDPYSSDVRWQKAWNELKGRDEAAEQVVHFAALGQFFLVSFIIVLLVKIVFFSGPIEPARENQISSEKNVLTQFN